MDLSNKTTKELYELIRACNDELYARYTRRISKMSQSSKNAPRPKVEERYKLMHAKIVKLRNEGFTVNQIINKLNISQSSYYRYLNYTAERK